MKQGFNIAFYCRESKRTKSGTAPLEISININGERRFINLPYKITPEEFHRKRQPKTLTDYMALMRTRINEILTEMLRNAEPVTTKALIEYLKNGGYKAYTVEDLFNEFLDIKKEQVGKSLTAGVFRKYELVRDLFFEGIDPRKECDSQLTHANILKFKVKVENRYEQATAAGYLRKLKTVIYFAIDNGKVKTSPFAGIKIEKGLKPIVYLSKGEQQALKNTTIENASLARVRDCAVFQMSTGLSYADLKNLRKEDIRCEGGTYYIQAARQKTGKVFTAVILADGVEIMRKYGGEVPVLACAKYNEYLKVIADLCGIRKRLTTHVMRKTYATNLLNSGVRIETVAAALGHSTKICQRYYAELQQENIISEITSKVG